MTYNALDPETWDDPEPRQSCAVATQDYPRQLADTIVCGDAIFDNTIAVWRGVVAVVRGTVGGVKLSFEDGGSIRLPGDMSLAVDRTGKKGWSSESARINAGIKGQVVDAGWSRPVIGAESFDDALKRFLETTQHHIETTRSMTPKFALTTARGKKYIKVIGDGRYAFCFIDISNGDVLYASSWSRPAPKPRGNIYSTDFEGYGVDWHGAKMLRGN